MNPVEQDSALGKERLAQGLSPHGTSRRPHSHLTTVAFPLGGRGGEACFPGVQYASASLGVCVRVRSLPSTWHVASRLLVVGGKAFERLEAVYRHSARCY